MQRQQSFHRPSAKDPGDSTIAPRDVEPAARVGTIRPRRKAKAPGRRAKASARRAAAPRLFGNRSAVSSEARALPREPVAPDWCGAGPRGPDVGLGRADVGVPEWTRRGFSARWDRFEGRPLGSGGSCRGFPARWDRFEALRRRSDRRWVGAGGRSARSRGSRDASRSR